MSEHDITSERLHQMVSYDPMTGAFIWVGRGRGIRTGRRAGSIDVKNGYRVIRIDKRDYYAQRLAWFWTHGAWPRLIRFQDENHDNCAIANLAEGFYLSTKHDLSTKEGRAAYQLEYRSERREKFNADHRQRKYGLDLATYAAMINAQDNKCAICRKEETETRKGVLRALAVDHDHSTGAVRDLLCMSCNKLIGLANEDRDTLLAAVKYLDKHSNGANVVPIVKKA